MTQASEIGRLKEHRNAFGFLRLLFASLVIVSHTPEMIDGNRSRELLTRCFGTISFGELAVDGFFIISGYLIVGSFMKKPHIWPYLKKRIARIYPGFIAASLIAIFIVAPLGGADLKQQLFSIRGIGRIIVELLTLAPPTVAGAFQGNTSSALDGAMWSIGYEFRCYMLVLALGLTGAFRRPALIGTLGIALLLAAQFLPAHDWIYTDHLVPHIYKLWGGSIMNARLMGIFLTGSYFFLKADDIRFSPHGAMVAAAGLLLSLFSLHFAEIGVATCGAYLIFAIAGWGKSGLISRINNRNDISYGVYLYAWPVAQLIIWYLPDLPVVVSGLFTLLAACLCGWISWFALEKPVMKSLRDRNARQPESPAAVRIS